MAEAVGESLGGEPELGVWLRGALTGEPRATSRLLDALRPVLVRRALRVLGARAERADLEDLVQDCFVRLLADDRRLLRSWDPQRGLSLRNFVGMICERQMRLAQRARARHGADPLDERGEPPSAADSPERCTELGATLRAVTRRLEQSLTPQGCALFRMLYVEEESVARVCSALSMSADAVYAWRSRMREMLSRESIP
jgi:RNA polymerase sigma-70 factor (ECF subfamily)